MKTIILLLLTSFLCVAAQAQVVPIQSNSVVRFRISHGQSLVGDIDVELFDADKPVTVSNFLAYAQSGAYSNSILHQSFTNFTVQGGLLTVANPASTDPFSAMTLVRARAAITNEFLVGPRYGNVFGTLSMAKTDANPNTATTSWFFNLDDNAVDLDNRNGGYTVFGRMIAGTNLLQGFNSLSRGNGIITMTNTSFLTSCSALFLYPGGAYTPLTDLPVGSTSGACPRYSDLFSVQVIMLSARDVLPPTLTVTTPTANATVTTSTLAVAGTATDNGRIAGVFVTLNNDSPLTVSTNNGPWFLTLTNLPPGTNTILVRAIDTGGNRTDVSRKIFHSVRVPLTVLTNGFGSVTGATNNAPLELGRSYTLIAKPARGHLFEQWTGSTNSTSPTLRFLMESNLSFTAVFVSNLFPNVKGAYNGLFHDTNGAEQASSGYFTFSVGDAGAYSGKLLLNGKSHSLKGILAPDGTGSSVVLRKGTNMLRAVLALDLTNGTDQITGTVTEETTSNVVWTADLLADRAVFNTKSNTTPLAGKYTVIIPPDTNHSAGPGGDGFGAVTIKPAGALALSGTLADGTAFAQKTTLSKNGHWPLYVPLYKGKGSVVSWVNFDTNQPATDLAGTFHWFKQAQAAKLYKLGFTNESTLVGSRFTTPFPTNQIFSYTNAFLGFTNGNLVADFTNAIRFEAKGKVVNEGSNKLSLTINKSSGLFTGSVTPPSGGKAVSYKGAVLQKQDLGSGFHIGTNDTGRVNLEGR